MRTCLNLMLALGIAAVVTAQEEIRLADEVITAEKREGSGQDAALSVTSVSGDELEATGFDTLEDASLLVPNLFVSQFNVARLTFPTIRGVGSGQGNPAVVTYLDDVPQLTFNTAGMPLLDLERLEVLRGPQGTLYGRNALGGVIHAVSREPGAEFSGRGRLGFGSDQRVEGDLSLSGPASDLRDDLFFGLTLSGREREGYVRNANTGNIVDDSESRYARTKLRWVPNDEWDATATVFGEASEDGGFVLNDLAALAVNPYQVNYDFEGESERDAAGASLRLRRHGEAVSFLSVTSIQASDISESTDIDFGVFDPVFFPDNRVRRVDETQEQLYQEFRLFSSEDAEVAIADSLDLGWLVGLSLWRSEVDNESEMIYQMIDFGSGPLTQFDAIDQEDDGIALFGETTLGLGDAFDVTVGARVAYEDKEATMNSVYNPGGGVFPTTPVGVPPLPVPQPLNGARNADESYVEWLPKFALAYRPSETVMVYGRAERGYKSGGFNVNSPAGAEQYDTETSWSYELGLKWRDANDRWRIRAAAFMIDWEDMQLTQPVGNGLFFVDNAGEAESYGAELEVAALVTDEIRAFGTFGVVNTEFEQYLDPYKGDVSGNELNNVPSYTWSLGAEWRKQAGEWEFMARADFTGTGEVWYDAGNSVKQDPWTVANFRVGASRGSIGVEAWVRNAFEEEYVPIALQVNGVGFPDRFVGQSGAPQEIGAALVVRF